MNDDVDRDAVERRSLVGGIVDVPESVVGTRPSGLSLVPPRPPSLAEVVRGPPPPLNVVEYLDVVATDVARSTWLVDR